MKKDLSCRNYLVKEDGTAVLFDKLTEKERTDFADLAGKKIANALCEYFSLYPDEFENNE
ncbi:MAG: hypothetical protein PUF57_04975 [Clostridiaceae bacterium]|nr:hypothetical protein [Clostridiaceae bacterium]